MQKFILSAIVIISISNYSAAQSTSENRIQPGIVTDQYVSHQSSQVGILTWNFVATEFAKGAASEAGSQAVSELISQFFGYSSESELIAIFEQFSEEITANFSDILEEQLNQAEIRGRVRSVNEGCAQSAARLRGLIPGMSSASLESVTQLMLSTMTLAKEDDIFLSTMSCYLSLLPLYVTVLEEYESRGPVEGDNVSRSEYSQNVVEQIYLEIADAQTKLQMTQEFWITENQERVDIIYPTGNVNGFWVRVDGNTLGSDNFNDLLNMLPAFWDNLLFPYCGDFYWDSFPEAEQCSFILRDALNWITLEEIIIPYQQILSDAYVVFKRVGSLKLANVERVETAIN